MYRRKSSTPTMASSEYPSDSVKRPQNQHFDSEEKFRHELAKTVTLTPELYERLFLSPKTEVAGDLRSRLGNPTGVGLLGFCVAIFPFSIALIGWQGSGGLGIATGGINVIFGGVLLFLAAIGEFLLGNTFSMMVFFAYGAHFMAWAVTFMPGSNAVGYFNPAKSGVGSPGTANQSPEFLASYAFYLLAVCLLSFIFLLGSIRVNGVFVMMFLFAIIGFDLGAGAFINLSWGYQASHDKLAVGTGACLFIVGLFAFYLLVGFVIATMELPIPDLPVYDLSTRVKPRSVCMYTISKHAGSRSIYDSVKET